jgi:hypothetical protein
VPDRATTVVGDHGLHRCVGAASQAPSVQRLG